MALGDLQYRIDTASFPDELWSIGSNPYPAAAAFPVYIRVFCSAASTIPGSGVQVTWTWNDPSGAPQSHDTIISLDTLGTSSVPEIFLACLAPNPEPLNFRATLVGDGEFTIEYAMQSIFGAPP